MTRILFESGARISEVVGLTLGDWIARGMTQEALASAKEATGDVSSFSSFRQIPPSYFDEERCQLDPHRYTLEAYLTLIKNKQIDPQTVPLFLTAQRSALSPKVYREHAWNPACRASGIDADVHQARHWHVTLAVRFIYETATTEGEVQRRLQELVEYMSGEVRIRWRHTNITLTQPVMRKPWISFISGCTKLCCITNPNSKRIPNANISPISPLLCLLQEETSRIWRFCINWEVMHDGQDRAELA